MDRFAKAIKKCSCITKTENKNDQAIQVVFGIDADFARPLGVAITSILKNNEYESFVFHIFADDLLESDLGKVKELADSYGQTVYIYYVDRNVVKDLPTNRRISAAVYSKLIMGRCLCGIAKKVLYLDSDILCVGRLRPFYEVDLDHNIVAVVSENEKTTRQSVSELSLRHGKYFNAGIMLVDIEQWNAENISDRAVELRLSGEVLNLYHIDQDVLNILLDGKSKYVDWGYNYLYNYRKDEPITAPEGTVIIHYAGPQKPWFTWLADEPMSALYLKYADRSSWRDVALIAPRNYKDMKYAAKAAMKQKKYREAMDWYMKYAIHKVKAALSK